jgi:hypothetical protein
MSQDEEAAGLLALCLLTRKSCNGGNGLIADTLKKILEME